MPKKKPAPEQAAPPPPSTVEIGGKLYQLSYTWGALVLAKQKLRQIGLDINIMRGLDFVSIDVDTLPVFFYGALREHHPETTWAWANEQITLASYVGIFLACYGAYLESVPAAEEKEDDRRPTGGPALPSGTAA